MFSDFSVLFQEMITLDDFDDFTEKKKLRRVSNPSVKNSHSLRGCHFQMISEAEAKIQFSNSKSKFRLNPG